MTISRAVAFVLLITVVLAAFPACDTVGGSAPGAIEEFILEDASTVMVMDVRGYLEAIEAPIAGPWRLGFSSDADDFEDALDDWREGWDRWDASLGNSFDDISEIMLVESNDFGYVVVKGEFFFEDMRYELEDENYEDDVYRDIEIWEDGSQTIIAFFEASGVYMWGYEDAVKEVVRAVYRGEGFADAENNVLIGVLGKTGKGLMFMGNNGCSERLEVSLRTLRNCESLGVSIVGGSESEIELNGAVIFSSERRAAAGMDDIEDLIEDDDDVDVDVDDIGVDGRYVTFKATVFE